VKTIMHNLTNAIKITGIIVHTIFRFFGDTNIYRVATEN